MTIPAHTFIPEKNFIEILDTMPVCTVDVIFFNKTRTKTLLFKRKNEPLRGYFFSIGGRLLKNEKIKDAAVRQASREAGISIVAKNLFFGGVQDEIYPNSAFDKVSYHAVNIYFGYILDENVRVRLDNQHSEYGWIDVEEKTLHPFIKSRLKNLLLTT